MEPTVYMMLGLPGSGKTVYSKHLAKQLNAPRLSLDERYFARVGNTGQEHRDLEIEAEILEGIKGEMSSGIADGRSIVLDFGPWKRVERQEWVRLIESYGAH